MKKFSIILCLLPALSCAQLVKHDFAYYKQKTRELLPILGINETDIFFVATHKEISLHQRYIRQRHLKWAIIFLNIDKLGTLTHDAALFECLLEVQMTNLNWKKYTVTSSGYEYSTLIHIFLVCYFTAAKFVLERYTSHAVRYACLITLPWTFMGYYYEVSKEQNLIHKLEEKIVDTIDILLWEEKTAQLAFVGFEQHLKDIPTNRHCGMRNINWQEEPATALEGITSRFREWIRLHPTQWQEIKKELKSETIELIEKTSA